MKARTTGSVYVEKADVLEDLLSASDGHDEMRGSTRGSVASSRRSPRKPDREDSEEIKKFKNREYFMAQFERTQIETKKNIEKSMKRQVDKKTKHFVDLSTDIEQCQATLDGVDKALQLHDEAQRTKARRQFEDWNANVHGKIQGIITSQVNAMDQKQLNALKNSDYAKFLDITNRKAAIFRDIIIESEYDPLEPNRRVVKAAPGKLKDPTLLVIQKGIDEASMLDIEPGKARARVRTGKDTLPVEQWASGKIEATPHGRFAKMMDISKNSSQRNAKMQSKVVFDHYSYPVGKEALDSEMPLGKKIIGNAIKSNIDFRSP